MDTKEENKPTLSVVIPAYNVEKYIDRCLKSVLHQGVSPDEYEIIVVDDGSTDSTYKKACRFEGENLKVVRQENKGLSMARNGGGYFATGKYLWFVDSDDCVTDDALKNIIDAARTDPDVIAINKRTEFKNGTASTESFTEKQLSSCCGSELLKNGCAVNAVLYICSRNFLEVNNLKFYPGIFHEDLEFTPRMLFKAKRITFVNKPLYIVHKHSNSITTTVNPKRAYDYITVANSLRTFVIQNKSAYDKYLYRYVGRAVCNAMRVAGECDKNDQNEFIKFFSKDVQNSFVSSLLRTVNWKYMFIGCLFMLCPQKSVYIYNRCLKQR